MTSILYPIAGDSAAALVQPMGRAARAREAQALAGEAVTFVTESMGQSYADRESALNAFYGRLEDDRPGRTVLVLPEDRFCRLAQVAVGVAPPTLAPTLKDGRRWPTPPTAPPATVWRLEISYWRPVSAAPQARADEVQARKARRNAGEPVDPRTLRALTRQPLRAVRPQQPLDIGLFERRLPESPHIVVPDE